MIIEIPVWLMWVFYVVGGIVGLALIVFLLICVGIGALFLFGRGISW